MPKNGPFINADWSLAVFDLETNNTYLAPYANCGTQPVSLNSPSDLTSITGTCTVAQAAQSSSTDGLGPSSGASTSMAFGVTNWVVIAAATCAALALFV